MEPSDKFELVEELSLEPLEGASAPPTTPKAPAKFQIDTRGKSERRVQADRRDAVRFEEDRRQHKDRRNGANPWQPGVDI